MKKIIFSLLIGFSVSSAVAQSSQFDTKNARDGESVEYCTAHKKHQEFLGHPEAAQILAQDELIRQQEAIEGTFTPKATVYYIPIVFHVLHNNGIENISDQQIFDALAILNRDYRRQNQDANSVHPDFQGLPADMEIEFRLATKAPDGTCFNGITRTVSDLTNDGSEGADQVAAIVAGNDVYQGQWPGNRYLNVFICKNIGGAAGYTRYPTSSLLVNGSLTSGTSMNNGIWILHNYLGSIGTSSAYTSRSLTHECGHWLNLAHPWGNSNNPGQASNCNIDDGVADTPLTRGVTSCNLNENSCGPRANVENYMDYSYCSKMFTPGQVSRARVALTSSVGGRNNLITASNHNFTGIANPVLCKSEFSSDKRLVCAGGQLTFNDHSYNNVSAWNWTFEGGTPASSTSQNPTVTYNTPGTYAVTLTATDGSSNMTETKAGYVTVFTQTGGLPFFEGFENYSSLESSIWRTSNPNGNNEFELFNGTGHSGSKCVKLGNYGQPADQKDELLSPLVDLSGVAGTVPMTFSFRYSYKRKTTNSDEWLRFFITRNCGETWSQRKTIHGSALSSDVVSSPWQPSNKQDWTTVHVTNISSIYRIENFRYKFQFQSDAGNNIYLDDINIYEGSPSNDIVLGINETGGLVNDLLTFPNPTEDELNVRFTIENSSAVNLSVKNIAGQVLQSTKINANAGSNLVLMDVNSLSQGMYFLELRIGNAIQTIQFLVK